VRTRVRFPAPKLLLQVEVEGEVNAAVLDGGDWSPPIGRGVGFLRLEELVLANYLGTVRYRLQ
jgi:hypothetical protein